MNLKAGVVHRVVLTGLAIGLAISGINAQEKPGKIQIIKASGNVMAVRASDHKSAPAKTGDIVTEGSVIQTGKDSTAVLLFGNGSAITLKPDSSFSVDTFQQDPFDQSATNYKDLEAEPSKSKTKVTLSKGELVGDMRKLNKGSSWDFNTPLGVAGIRGTKVYISVTTDANGVVTVHIAAAEGLVSVTTKSGQTYQVGKGEEITLTYNKATPEDVKASIAKLSPEQQTEIEQTADQSVDVIPGTPFAPTDNVGVEGVPTGDQGVGTIGTQIGGSGGGGGGGASPTPTPTPTPAPPAS
ncbi:hypothetical protein BH09VER1_BH09VER1_35890 [soil metagenome]